MQSRRLQRVEKEVRQIVSEHIISGLKMPLNGMVSVSRVSVSPDLKSARVFITELLDNDEIDQDIDTLNDSRFSFQKEISSRLRMKFCPKLRFVADPGYSNMLKVNQVLNDLNKN